MAGTIRLSEILWGAKSSQLVDLFNFQIGVCFSIQQGPWPLNLVREGPCDITHVATVTKCDFRLAV